MEFAAKDTACISLNIGYGKTIDWGVIWFVAKYILSRYWDPHFCYSFW
jgi:hypothetical protein